MGIFHGISTELTAQMGISMVGNFRDEMDWSEEPGLTGEPVSN